MIGDSNLHGSRGLIGMALVWLVTGASDDMGRAIVESALKVGDYAFADGRDSQALARLADVYPGHLAVGALDTGDEKILRGQLGEVVQRFGRLDVVVNADTHGFRTVGPRRAQATSLMAARDRFDHFWEVFALTAAAVDVMAPQRAGLIIQISSVAGRVGGNDGHAVRDAAEFAVDGFSRGIAAEVASTGLSVMVVQGWGLVPPSGLERAAAVLVTVAHRQTMPSHLLLGESALLEAVACAQAQLLQAREWADVSRSVDAGKPFPVPLPP